MQPCAAGSEESAAQALLRGRAHGDESDDERLPHNGLQGGGGGRTHAWREYILSSQRLIRSNVRVIFSHFASGRENWIRLCLSGGESKMPCN